MLIRVHMGVMFSLLEADVVFVKAVGMKMIVSRTRYSPSFAFTDVIQSSETDWSSQYYLDWYGFEHKCGDVRGLPPTKR